MNKDTPEWNKEMMDNDGWMMVQKEAREQGKKANLFHTNATMIQNKATLLRNKGKLL